MCLNQEFNLIRKTQAGSALVLAIFILVVMLLLGTALSRMLSSSADSIAFEVIGIRAFQAANIGAQNQLTKLFPLNASAKYCNGDDIALPEPADPAPVINYMTSFEGVTGLNNCRVSRMVCSDFKVDDVVFYRVQSTGQCDIGEQVIERTIELEARSL
ncbi:PilX N-terminal domain-containing pilus assembly protein [Colwellia sp. MEBiC06753]